MVSIQHPWRGENKFLERVFHSPDFKKLYLAKLDLFRQTVCRPERFYAQDGAITREEFVRGFQKWFQDWDTEKSGWLTDEQLRTGINQALMPPGFGPPGGPGGREQ